MCTLACYRVSYEHGRQKTFQVFPRQRGKATPQEGKREGSACHQDGRTKGTETKAVVSGRVSEAAEDREARLEKLQDRSH